MKTDPNLIWLIGIAAFLIVLEKLFPLREQRRQYLPRLVTNLFISFFLYSAAYFTVKPLSTLGLNFVDTYNLGILSWIPTSMSVKYVVGFLLMDLSFYYWHLLNHEVGWLWRFHAVHHMDPDLDVSTSFRFHFFEVAYSMFFRFAQVLVIGVPLELYMTYEFIFQILTFFHHSNLGLPPQLDRLLNWIIVTPRMHGIHHSTVKDEANSNYSVIFSLWDRIHRSFVSQSKKTPIEIGVVGYSLPPDNKFDSLIMAPFKKQRDYWT